MIATNLHPRSTSAIRALPQRASSSAIERNSHISLKTALQEAAQEGTGKIPSFEIRNKTGKDSVGNTKAEISLNFADANERDSVCEIAKDVFTEREFAENPIHGMDIGHIENGFGGSKRFSFKIAAIGDTDREASEKLDAVIDYITSALTPATV